MVQQMKQFISVDISDGVMQIGISGDWTILNLSEVEDNLMALRPRSKDHGVVFHCNGLTGIDTSGAWLLYSKYKALDSEGYRAEFTGFRESHFKFVKSLYDISDDSCPEPEVRRGFLYALEDFGRLTHAGVGHIAEALEFTGRVFGVGVRGLVSPSRLRFSSIVRHVQETGINALPIVGLLAFLVSIVLTYQGATQLQEFGASIFTIDLVAISILREMGVLMTAILVAGRSGSAFAAEIGVMKLREEIDAMKVMGIEPFEVLVLPRIIGLMIALPILTLFADLIGLAAGGLVGVTLLDVSITQYLIRLNEAVNIQEFWVGMSKAPVFAFIIATVSTFRGMQASGSSESVGRLTTISVVQSIFLVILADAVFSVIFAELGI